MTEKMYETYLKYILLESLACGCFCLKYIDLYKLHGKRVMILFIFSCESLNLIMPEACNKKYMFLWK